MNKFEMMGNKESDFTLDQKSVNQNSESLHVSSLSFRLGLINNVVNDKTPFILLHEPQEGRKKGDPWSSELWKCKDLIESPVNNALLFDFSYQEPGDVNGYTFGDLKHDLFQKITNKYPNCGTWEVMALLPGKKGQRIRDITFFNNQLVLRELHE